MGKTQGVEPGNSTCPYKTLFSASYPHPPPPPPTPGGGTPLFRKQKFSLF